MKPEQFREDGDTFQIGDVFNEVKREPQWLLSDDLIRVRDFAVDDLHFIQKSWVRSLQSSQNKSMPEAVFYEKQGKIIGDLSEISMVRVLCDKEQEFYIYGWTVGTKLTNGDILLHYVYVRPEWRKKGLAFKLVKALGWERGRRLIATEMTEFIKGYRLQQRGISFFYDKYLIHELTRKRVLK